MVFEHVIFARGPIVYGVKRVDGALFLEDLILHKMALWKWW
jgi:hypothetical protein